MTKFNELTITELIELAKKEGKSSQDVASVNQESRIKDYLDEAQKFIITFKIKDGTILFPVSAAYPMYKKWALNPIPEKEYMAQFKKYFNVIKKSDQSGFMLNISSWDLDLKVTDMVATREKNKTL